MESSFSATGYAYSEVDGKKSCFYFKLNNLKLTYYSCFGKHQSKYKFDVYSLFVSDIPKFNINQIYNCCIRTSLMDKWLWNYTQSSYFCPYSTDENSPIELKYEAKPSLTLYESSKCRIYIKFSNSMSTPDYKGFNMSANCFLNINMKKKTTFYDSLDLTEYIIWLFSMLWNNNFNPDFIEFKTPKTKFIYKQSDRYSYKYRNIENTYLTTAISDYEGSDMSIIINNWLELIDNYKNAFSTFFETLFNEHTTPSSAIKNYISVIDGLSKDFDVPSDGQTTNAQKIKKIKPIFDKIKPSLTSKEFNELKMAVLRESTKDIKCRFNYLIKSLSQYIQINLKDDFCPKVIETRNSITHPKSAKKDVFSKEQYIDVAFCLEKIIKAYLFMKIKVSPSAAKKILKAIEMPEI